MRMPIRKILAVSQIMPTVASATIKKAKIASPSIPENGEKLVVAGATKTIRIIIIVGANRGMNDNVKARTEFGSCTTLIPSITGKIIHMVIGMT